MCLVTWGCHLTWSRCTGEVGGPGGGGVGGGGSVFGGGRVAYLLHCMHTAVLVRMDELCFGPCLLSAPMPCVSRVLCCAVLCHHTTVLLRSWLSGCLRQVGAWQGGAAADALTRPELLYMLYAAARLRVSPGDSLLSAALRRLHRELPAATPAELAGCLSVFCYWWRQQSQQQQQQLGDSAGRSAAAADGSSRGVAGVQGGAGGPVPPRVIGLLELRDCLSAVVACGSQFSDEGLLQLLVTCAKAGLGAGQQQDVDSEQRLLLAGIQGSIVSLVGLLAGRLPRMSLVELARVSRTLEGVGGVGNSGGSVGVGGSANSGGRPAWHSQLLLQVKGAMGSRA